MSEDIASTITQLAQMRATIDKQAEIIRNLSNPPFSVADVIDVIDDDVVIIRQRGNNMELATYCSPDLEQRVLPGAVVAINAGCVIMSVLRGGKDPRVHIMELMSKPTTSYAQIGGLEKQIRDIREVVELPLLKPDAFTRLNIEPPKAVLLYGPPGTGKCLGFNTPVIMFDGSVKPVQSIKENDMLMGPDSKHRCVTGVTHGYGDLYKITTTKGDSFICNSDHILNLRMCGTGDLLNIPVHEYLKKSNGFKHYRKIWKTGFELPAKKTDIDPYVMGLWLGDGAIHQPMISHTIADREIIPSLEKTADQLGICLRYEPDARENSGNWIFSNGRTGGKSNPFTLAVMKCYINGEKRISSEYLYNSRENRMKLLAGLIDTDGYKTGNACIEITTKYSGLADDIRYLAASLGFMVTVRNKVSRIKSLGFSREYYRVFISGETSKIPIQVERKKCPTRKQIKNVLNFGFTVEYIGKGDYYGFCLDGDGLFILGNFIVTHNTAVAKAVASATNATFFNMASTELVAKFIGEGAKLVRELFQLARDKAPSIIFFDEIDALCKVRTNDGTVGSDEVQRTMMQLLAELDGFNIRGNVRIIAATNRIDVIDPALLRPGRFDRLIEIPLPDEAARLEILKIHTTGVPHDANLVHIAKITDKFNGAQLKAVVTEAGMIAIRRDADMITNDDFLEAVKMVTPQIAISCDPIMCW